MSEQNLEVVKQFEHHAMYERDFEAAMRFAHPDLVVREAPSLPYRGEYVGIEGQHQLLADVDEIWEFDGGAPAMEFHDAGDDVVVSRVTGQATLRATGQQVDFDVVEWFILRDGKLAEINVYYWDAAPLLAAAWVENARRPLSP